MKPKLSIPTNGNLTSESRITIPATKPSITPKRNGSGAMFTLTLSRESGASSNALLSGAFHKMSVKHMDKYIEELEWRLNNRDNPHIFIDNAQAGYENQAS